MPLITYEPRKFQGKSLTLIGQANKIIEQYQGQGYDLTLRQLYYQLVTKNVIPNNKESYDRLGSLISNARRAGLVDWEAIVDRTRGLESPSAWNSPEEILAAVSRQYRARVWDAQPNYVECLVPGTPVLTDHGPRFLDYQANFGDDSWELDALDPIVIGQLVDTEVRKLIDHSLWTKSTLEEDTQRDQLAQISDKFDDIAQALENGDI